MNKLKYLADVVKTHSFEEKNFQEKLGEEGVWDIEGDGNILWNEMSGCIKRVAKC